MLPVCTTVIEHSENIHTDTPLLPLCGEKKAFPYRLGISGRQQARFDGIYVCMYGALS